jgi:hypothetical protein
LYIPQFLILHQAGNVQQHDQPGAVIQLGDTRKFHPAIRCDARRRFHQAFRHVQHFVNVIHHQPRTKPSASTTMMRWSSWMF